MPTIFSVFFNFLFLRGITLTHIQDNLGGYSGFQDRNDRMAAKFKIQNIPLGFQQNLKKIIGPKINPQKIPCQICGFLLALSSICARFSGFPEMLKSRNSELPQKMLANFPTKRILGLKTLKTPKYPLIIPIT